MSDSLWITEGRDEDFERYRTSNRHKDLCQWADNAYYGKNLRELLDKNFVEQFQNHDFFARLWELELAEWLSLTGLKLVPTNGSGPDFCIELSDGRKIWVEAVLATPDEELDRLWRDNITKLGEPAKVYNTPVDAMTLRYTNSLCTKADKIKTNYLSTFSSDDIILIAISAFPPGALKPDIEFLLRAIMPMDNPVIHISTNGKPLDPSVVRATHAAKLELLKRNGSTVPKQFLYPGDNFPYIDGVLFTEASNLQNLLGRTSFLEEDDSNNVPHVFPNYSSAKELPDEFTDNFYSHVFVERPPLISLETIEPKKKLM